MVANESPAVARRRLRLALRRAREEKGFTRNQVAEALEWSLSKINRIESGHVTVSSTDLRALISLYDIRDEALVDQLIADARAARQRGWWDDPRFRQHLPPGTLNMIQFESRVTTIRNFQPFIIPGLLQTRAYAEAVLNLLGDLLSEEDRAARLEARLRRQSQVFDRPDPPLYLVILEESVVHREVGGLEVFADQLDRLYELSQQPGILIRVLPSARSALLSMVGAFTILDLDDEADAVLYKEDPNSDEVIYASDVIRRHRNIYEQMWEQALSVDASRRLVQARAAKARATLDRYR